MAFLAGRTKTGGRRAGVPNKLTTAFREAVQVAYERIGGHEAFAKWAKENPTEFYRIAARLIPTAPLPIWRMPVFANSLTN